MQTSFINYDLALNKTFIGRENKVGIFHRPRASDHELTRDIYFQPSYCPVVTIHDYSKGSCFRELEIPSASYQIRCNNGHVSLTPAVEKKLQISQYVDKLYHNIRTDIIDIYDRHSVVNLCYSGGIDSLVLLSFVIELELLPRTRIITFENHTQTHTTCLHVNQYQLSLVKSLLQSVQKRCLGIDYYTFDITDIARVFNTHGLAELKCYATQSLLERYQDQAFLMGYHGNQILLHKNIFFDELLIQQPSWLVQLESYIATRHDYYTASAAGYKIPQNLVPLERRHLLAKPWDRLDHYRGNRLYSPIGSNDNFQMTRSLDFAKIHPDVILDAQVARTMIAMNPRADLSQYIGIESTKDNDNLEEIKIPADLIDPKNLLIPENLIHDPEGVSYIQDEIQRMPATGWLAINTAVSIKSLQHIATHYK